MRDKDTKNQEVSIFHGEQDHLRGCMAQLLVDYTGVGWESKHDNDKNVNALSLLRRDGLKW